MNELRKQLCIDEYLELLKEDKNCNGAYISFGQYIDILEKRWLNKGVDEQMDGSKILLDLGYKFEHNCYSIAKCIPNRINTEKIIFKYIYFDGNNIYLKQKETDAFVQNEKEVLFNLDLEEIRAIELILLENRIKKDLSK